MSAETNDRNRRREIVDICLKKLIEKGLYETTSRDLTDALNMRPSALYYHFKSKDDAVLECAEEAAIRLEERLLLPALEMMDGEIEQAEDTEEIQAMTRFLAQVCTANKYRQQMKPVLKRIREREYAYCKKFAEKLNCSAEELAPWFFAAVASSESYMIFGAEAFSSDPKQYGRTVLSLVKERFMDRAQGTALG